MIAFAAKASDVGSGAALTLVIPLVLLVVALGVWFFAFRALRGP